MIFSKRTYFLFIVSMIALIVFSYLYLDRELSLYFMAHADTYKTLGKRISITGESQWYFIIAILGALYSTYIKKNRLYQQRFLFLLYINLFSGLLSILLKIFFGRLRPWNLEHGKDKFGFLINQNPDFTFLQDLHYQITMLMKHYANYASFPSGHTVTIMATFTYIALLFPKYISLWGTIALIGVGGRVLANDHFLSDIIAGSLVGVLSTLFLYSKMRDKILTDLTH